MEIAVDAKASANAQFTPAMHALLAAHGGALAVTDAPARPQHGADAPAVHDLALRRAGDVAATFDALAAAAPAGHVARFAALRGRLE